MKCKYCGSQINSDSKFCEICGQSTQADKKKKRRRSLIVFIVFILAVAVGLYAVTMLVGGADFDPDPTPGWLGDGEDTEGYSELSGEQGNSLQLSGLREYYTQLKGNGEDIVTIMVYMCGADLESSGGSATSDLVEMIEAGIGEGVNVIVQTGGATRWQNDVISSSVSERYLLSGEGVRNLNCNLKQLRMTDGNTLRDFVKFCAKNYPADRYMLIMWDHGGGTLGGYGYDENFPNQPSMSLSAMDAALTSAGVKFDIVGFDACLMATLETAYMLADHADYLIASEETEPANGWYYTDWLKTLNGNTSVPSRQLGAQIIDDYISSTGRTDYATLSLVDLREVPYVYKTMCDFLAEAEGELTAYDFQSLSRARSESKSYGDGGFDQIDLAHFVSKTGLSSAQALKDAINSAVAYRGSRNVSVACGLAVYFPYEFLEYYEPMLTVLKNIGMTSDYTRFFSDFVTVMAGGQIAGYTEAGGEAPDYSDCDWFDASLVDNYGDYYETYNYNELPIIDKGEYFALQLTDKEWELVSSVELQVFLDDNEGGLIDLGSDNVFEFDDDGDLMVDFDYTWVAVDGNIVAYYCLYEEYNSDDDWYTYGYSPATLNDELVDIIIRWDNENPSGYVVGARMSYSESSVAAKGIIELEQGDKLQFVIDYYDTNGEYMDSYYYGDEITVKGELEVSYEDVGDFDTYIFYIIKDVYGTVYTTESVLLY